MGGKNNGRTGRILHHYWEEVRTWAEDPEHPSPSTESRPDGELQVLGSRASRQPGEA